MLTSVIYTKMVFIRAKKMGGRIIYYLIKTQFNKERGWSEQKIIRIGDKEELKELVESIQEKLKK